jgi:hypothetical protein
MAVPKVLIPLPLWPVAVFGADQPEEIPLWPNGAPWI